MTTIFPADHDAMRNFLRDEYRENDPIWNFLRYKSGAHVVTVGNLAFREIDQYILRDELAEIPAPFTASPDMIASLWRPVSSAIELDSGDKYTVRSARVDGVQYSTLEQFLKVGGRWCEAAAEVPVSRQYLGLRLLLDMHEHESGRYRNVTSKFENVARLINHPGNMLLVPVIRDGRKPSQNNLNLVRSGRDGDSFDRTLSQLQSGGYRDFFPDPSDANPLVAPRFRLARTPDGLPTPAALRGFVKANHLRAFYNTNGDVREAWVGSLAGGNRAPRTPAHCNQWIASTEAFISERDADLFRG